MDRQTTPAPDAPLSGREFMRRFRWLVFHTWNIPPIFGLGFILLIGVLTPAQVVGILTTPLEPAYILGWLAFALWFLPRRMRPVADWLDARPGASAEAALASVRRFPLLFWATFLIYLVIAPASVILAAELYTDYVAKPVDWFRIELVALIVSIIVGLPIFFLMFDLFGRALGGLDLARPVLTLRTRVFLIGALVPLLIDTMLVQYYWTRTGYFTLETFWVWLLLEGIAIGGSLIFAHSFGQALTPLQALGAGSPPPSLRARSTDEIGVLVNEYRALLDELALRNTVLDFSNRLLRELGNAEDLPSVLSRLVELCREALAAERAYLAIRTPNGEILGVAESGKDYRAEGHWRVAAGEPSLAQWCLDQGQTAAVDDLEQDPRIHAPLRQSLGTRSALLVPLGRPGAWRGVLIASHHAAARHWTARDIALQESLAREATFILETHELRTEREEAERRRAADLALLRTLMDTAEEGIYGGDLEGRCLFINRAAVRMLGYDRPEELLGRHLHSLIHHTRADGSPYPAEECRVALATAAGLPAHSDEEVHWRKDGTSFPVEYWSRPMYQDGKLVGTVVSFVDITGRKEAEAAEARRQRTLQTLAAATDLMLKPVASGTMMRVICDLLVDKGGFSMAWIGMAAAEHRVTPVAASGFDAGYLPAADVRWDDSVRGQGPVGTAIREGRTVITEDTEADPAFTPWRNLARERGFRSVLATPIRVEGEVVGSLAVYASQPRAFGTHEITLAQRLAADLGHVLEREAADAAVRASEARLAEAQAIAHLGSWELDLQSGQAIWSAEEYRLLGYGPGEVAPSLEAFLAAIHPADQARVRAAMEASTHSPDGAYRVQHRVLGRDGRERVMLETGHTELDAQGKPRRMVGTTLDVTELHTISSALEETERRLRHVVTAAPVVLFALDAHGVFTLSEGAGLAALGLQPGQVVGQSVFELYHDPEIQSHVRRALAGEAFVVHAQVGRRYFEVHYQPVLDPAGQVSSVVGVAIDDTERALVEQELARYRAHLETLVAERTREVREQSTIIDQIHDAVVATDLDGHITFWNRGAERLFGYTAAEALGQPVGMVHLDADFLRDGIIRPLQEKGAHEVEVTMRRKDGSVFEGHLSLSMRHDAEGRPSGMIGYTIDITARKRTERLLKQRSDELAAINRELEAFSYSVSHDLRAPLRAIDGFSQALLEDYGNQLDAGAQDYLRRVRASAQRMARLIDDLLNLSRVTRAPLHYERVDLSAMAREVVAALRETAPGRAVTMHIAEGLSAEGDAALLRIALENLLGNAWKYTARTAQARIEFGSQIHDDERVFFVRDNGAGFDMKYANKLFGAFQRLHHPQEFEGTGVGLATVQRIIHRHGGRIWAEGEPDKGACFYFTLGTPVTRAG